MFSPFAWLLFDYFSSWPCFSSSIDSRSLFTLFLPLRCYRLWVFVDSDYLSDDIKEQIKTTFKKKRATKKDKEFMQDLLENVYIKTTFMKSDTPEIIQSKKAEIEEFLKSI